MSDPAPLALLFKEKKSRYCDDPGVVIGVGIVVVVVIGGIVVYPFIDLGNNRQAFATVHGAILLAAFQ